MGDYEVSDEILAVIQHFQSAPSVQEDDDLMEFSRDLCNWFTIAPHVWALDTDGDGEFIWDKKDLDWRIKDQELEPTEWKPNHLLIN